MQVRYFGKNVLPDTKILNAEQKKAILVKLEKAGRGDGYRAKIANYALLQLLNKIPTGDDLARITAAAGSTASHMRAARIHAPNHALERLFLEELTVVPITTSSP